MIITIDRKVEPDEQPLSGGAREKLLDLLAALGEHPDQIAASLTVRGHYGEPGDAIGCPIYRYLEHALGACDLEVAAVDACSIAMCQDYGLTGWSFSPPECVAESIERFDKDRYPELIRFGDPA